MPWRTGDVKRFSKKAARCVKRRRRWVAVANTILRQGGSDASAIRQANAASKHVRC